MSSDESASRRPAIAVQLGRKWRKPDGSLQRVCASPRIRALGCGTRLPGPLRPAVAVRCQRRLEITARKEAAEGLAQGARYSPAGGQVGKPALKHKPFRCLTLLHEQPIRLVAARPREILPSTAIYCHFVSCPKNEQDAGMIGSPSHTARLWAFGNLEPRITRMLDVGIVISLRT